MLCIVHYIDICGFSHTLFALSLASSLNHSISLSIFPIYLYYHCTIVLPTTIFLLAPLFPSSPSSSLAHHLKIVYTSARSITQTQSFFIIPSSVYYFVCSLVWPARHRRRPACPAPPPPPLLPSSPVRPSSLFHLRKFINSIYTFCSI